jgi:cell division protein FtsW (lipid II flippase)
VLRVVDGGAFLFFPVIVPLLFAGALATALPFSLSALGLIVGDVDRSLVVGSLGRRTGWVLTAGSVALLALALAWIEFSDASALGSAVVGAICAPVLLGFGVAVGGARRWVRLGALGLGSTEGLAVVVYFFVRNGDLAGLSGLQHGASAL